MGPIHPTYQCSPPLNAFFWQDVPEGRPSIIIKQFHFWCTSLPNGPRVILTLEVLIICMHISVTRLCIMGYLSNELWDLWDDSIGSTHKRELIILNVLHMELAQPSFLRLRAYCGISLQWRHNGHYDVSNHQPHDCLLNRLFRRRSKKTSKLLVTGLFVGNSPVTGEFPTQMASNVANASIWWRHHVEMIIWLIQVITVHASSLAPRVAGSLAIISGMYVSVFEEACPRHANTWMSGNKMKVTYVSCFLKT